MAIGDCKRIQENKKKEINSREPVNAPLLAMSPHYVAFITSVILVLLNVMAIQFESGN